MSDRNGEKDIEKYESEIEQADSNWLNNIDGLITKYNLDIKEVTA